MHEIRRTRSYALALSLLGTLVVVTGCRAPISAGYDDFPSDWAHRTAIPTAVGESAMVASADSLATTVGLETLRRGGNAVDAAVAVAFALAVTYPQAGNLGGGGFLVYRDPDGSTYTLDFREKAPAAATRDMYLDADGDLTDASRRGHLAAGVPGSVMGLWEVHDRFGALPWTDLVDPAVELAEGFVVGGPLASALAGASGRLSAYEATREAFLPGGRAPAAGETFRQPDLARTLARIRDEGPNGFYRGETARLIAEEMERGGGLITEEDLAEYTAVWRDPVRFTYRGHQVISMAPSSSGGATMALAANMLAPYDLGALGWHSSPAIHLVVEAWRRAYADRNALLADTDYADVPLERLVSAEYGLERGSDIVAARATPSDSVGPGIPPAEGAETTHFSVVAADGGAVALTTTINSLFGNLVTVAGAGFLLNNEMDDFSASPGEPNQFGLVQGEANAIEPGKRMLSAMSPTIVEDPEGRLLLVTGTPGGSTIITTVFQVVSNVVDFGMRIDEAMAAPRFHHQHLPDRVQFERDGLTRGAIGSLEAMGHALSERGGFSGNVQSIMILPDGGRLGVADPRGAGMAAGY